MSLFAFVADLHLANHRSHGGPMRSSLNTRCRHCLTALSRAVTRAVELKCDTLFVLGDVFDTVRPEPQLVAAVQSIIDVEGLPVIFVEGNHDMVSTQTGDHSLGPLGVKASIIDEPVLWMEGDAQVLAVPFEPGPAKEWLPRQVRKLLSTLPPLTPAPAGKRLLVTHVGISDDDHPSFMKATVDQVPVKLLKELCRECQISMVFAGNWHFHRIFDLGGGAKAVQVGTLSPTGWDNPGGLGHGIMPVWDTQTGRVMIQHIPGPRFLNVAQDRAELGDVGLSAAELQGCSVYVRVKSTIDGIPRVQLQLQRLQDEGLIAGFEVTPDDVEVRVAARTAATMARSAETLEAALAGYVEQMPLADTVDRGAVLRRAKSYLK